MTRKLLSDVSASTVQVILTQSLGLIVFLLTSLYLPKDIYGELNWSYAVCMFAINVLSLRLEHIVIKRAAIDKDPSRILTLFMIHVLLSGTGFYLILLALSFIFPSFFTAHGLLLLLAISQLVTFFSLPFKNIANGKEKFGYLAIMSSASVLIRVIWLFIMITFFQLTVQWVLAIFIISAVAEWLAGCWLVNKKMNITFNRHVRFADYTLLLKESLPQVGVAILMAGITRMDWILLGLFSTAAITAEYSFAYRVFELSPFPLLIIAPILLSRFSRYFSVHSEQQLLQEKKKLSLLVRIEMIMATFIPLLLNIIWVPLIDGLTDHKYGAVNQETFIILSFCIPFQYISNLIWSSHFAQHRLKLILKITFVTFCIILIGDLICIPLYDAKGAAFVFLGASIVEYINYMRTSELSKIKETWQSLLVCVLAAAGSGFAAFYFMDDLAGRLLLAIPSFCVLLLATRQLRLNDIVYVFQALKKTGPGPLPASYNDSNLPAKE